MAPELTLKGEADGGRGVSYAEALAHQMQAAQWAVQAARWAAQGE